MKEFVITLPHLHNIYPKTSLPLDARLSKRWVVQFYTPEIKLTHLENAKNNEIFIAFDNRFIVSFGEYSFNFGFNLFGFGFGVSRKTDKLMESDKRMIASSNKTIGA